MGIHYNHFIALEPGLWSLKWFAALAAIWLASAIFFDVYNLARASDAVEILQAVIGAVLLTTFVYTLTPFITPPLVSRGVLLVFFLAMLVGMIGLAHDLCAALWPTVV